MSLSDSIKYLKAIWPTDKVNKFTKLKIIKYVNNDISYSFYNYYSTKIPHLIHKEYDASCRN